MNVRELIEILMDIEDPESEVLLSIDPEGNGYSTVDELTEEEYIKEENWITGGNKNPNAVVIWPTGATIF